MQLVVSSVVILSFVLHWTSRFFYYRSEHFAVDLDYRQIGERNSLHWISVETHLAIADRHKIRHLHAALTRNYLFVE
jgi:hypothetical protein